MPAVYADPPVPGQLIPAKNFVTICLDHHQHLNNLATTNISKENVELLPGIKWLIKPNPLKMNNFSPAASILTRK
jgi:hypothetical protein